MVTVIADVPLASIEALLGRYDLALHVQADGEPITGSFWGDSEAGIVGNNVYVRNDTPVHSLLHETCHIICMSAERRANLETDAGGDDLEEAAVCYLQVVLADEIAGVGRQRTWTSGAIASGWAVPGPGSSVMPRTPVIG
jgi:hypothetical protein